MIYLPKWTEVLIALYNAQPEYCYCQRLKTSMTTKHLRNVICSLEEMKFIERKGGRIRYITLTDTGERLAELLLQIDPNLKK